MRIAGWIAITGSVALLLAACSTPAPPPPVAETTPPVEAPPPQQAAPARPQIESVPLKHLANRRLAPIPDRPIDVDTRCAFKDPTGYRGQLKLSVKKADVRQFDAEINVPRKGTCRFSLKGFRQTHTVPVVALNNDRDACTVRMWEQGNQVTVAFRDCQARCSGESFDYLWPILVDTKTGRCS